ncbi:MAG: MFS transporter [Planctomycetaceae bacterium]
MSAAEATKSGSLDAFREVFRNPNLRRLQLAWAGSQLGTWGFGVALAVYAYDRGGPAAVGLVALLRWIPSAIAAPFMGALGDRYPRRLVMVSSDLGRVVVISLAAAAVFLDLPSLVVYLLAALGVVISTAFRPAQAAITPSLVSTPDELTACNVVSSSIESVGMFLGPAIGGAILAVSGPGEVFVVAAVTFVWSALLISRIHTGERAEETESADEGDRERESFWTHATAGFATVLHETNARLIVGVFCAQFVIAGALVVLEVVIALDLLGRGDGWVGVIAAAFGIGGIAGGAIAGALVGRGRLAGDFAVGVLLWGLPLLVIGMWTTPAVVIVAMAAMGIGNTLVDVSGFTLLQRAVPEDTLARVFGVVQTLFLLIVAIGASVTPLLIDLAGAKATLLGFGCFLPIVIALTWRKLAAVDAAATAPERELGLLLGISFFERLPRPVLESLARRLEPFRLPAGTRLFEQGDRGDRFYVVASGAVDIHRDGVLVATIEPGGFFGEIALLHDVPRQASATARDDAELLALDGAAFVPAVTGHGPSAEAALEAMQDYGVPSLGI